MLSQCCYDDYALLYLPAWQSQNQQVKVFLVNFLLLSLVCDCFVPSSDEEYGILRNRKLKLIRFAFLFYYIYLLRFLTDTCFNKLLNLITCNSFVTLFKIIEFYKTLNLWSKLYFIKIIQLWKHCLCFNLKWTFKKASLSICSSFVN